ELLGQSHNTTWHAQQAIAHEVALLVRADDDLGWRRRGQRRPAGDRRQTLVGAPIAVGSIVQPNGRAGCSARRTRSEISHGRGARVFASTGEGTGAADVETTVRSVLEAPLAACSQARIHRTTQ